MSRLFLSNRFVDTYRDINVVRGTLLKPRTVMPNEWDGCLIEDHRTMEYLLACGGLEACCPEGKHKYRQKPWIAMPDGGRKFKPIQTLSVPDLTDPGNLNVDLDVLTEDVPNGYDGVITDVVCQVEGPGGGGLVEGSGDVTWRLSAAHRFLRDMGAITTSLGSLVSPSLVAYGGLRVYSMDTIRFQVSFGTNSSLTINPAGIVICSITGWYYPR